MRYLTGSFTSSEAEAKEKILSDNVIGSKSLSHFICPQICSPNSLIRIKFSKRTLVKKIIDVIVQIQRS